MSMNWMTTMEMTLMRDILFRGKRLDNGEWVLSGNIIRFIPENGEDLIFIPSLSEPCICHHDEKDNIIAFEKGMFYKVDTKTVGQYTGLKDKNGKLIFEGDIIKWDYAYNEGKSYQVRYDVGGACFFASREYNGDNTSTIFYNDEQHAEVIGNIHDSPELLERGE